MPGFMWVQLVIALLAGVPMLASVVYRRYRATVPYAATFQETLRKSLIGNDLTVLKTTVRPVVSLWLAPAGRRQRLTRIGVRELRIRIFVRHNTAHGYCYYTVTTYAPRAVDPRIAGHVARGLAGRSRREYFPDRRLVSVGS